MDKTVTMAITGDEQIIDSALDAFVRQHGWVDTINDSPNPQTQTEAARAILLRFILETVSTYNADQAAKLARTDAASQTEAALYSTVMTLDVT